MSVAIEALEPAPEASTAAPAWTRSVWPHVAFGTLAVLLVSSPLLFTDWTNAVDFTNAFWYASLRDWQITHGQGASYYIQSYGTGLFYPFFAFYGGGLFTAAGILSIVLGNHPIAAFEVIGVAAYTSAYAGTYSIGRQCGLNLILAHAPSLCVITSAYWITVIYGRGDWPEFIAISSIPTVVASAALILRSNRLRFWPVLAFLVADFFFISSHAITFAWGTTIILIVVAALFVVYRWHVNPVRWLKLAALVGIGMLTDAWSLGPIVAYSNDVKIAHDTIDMAPAATSFFDPFSVVFWPFRRVPAASTTPALFVQASDWFLVWALVVVGAFLVANRRWPGKRATLVIAAVFAGLLAFVLTSSTVNLPSPWKDIQFPYRLNSYIAFLTAGFVLIALLALQTARTRTKVAGFATLGAAAAVSIVCCVWQLFVPNTEQAIPPNGGHGSPATRADALTPPDSPPVSFEAFDDYADALDKTILLAPNDFNFPLSGLSANNQSFSEVATLPNGPIDTNISAGPEFITISGGVHRVGDDPDGRAVIERNVPGTAAVTVTITTNHNWMRVLPYVSGVGVLASLSVVALLGVTDGDAWRRRRRPEVDASDEDAVPEPN